MATNIHDLREHERTTSKMSPNGSVKMWAIFSRVSVRAVSFFSRNRFVDRAQTRVYSYRLVRMIEAVKSSYFDHGLDVPLPTCVIP